MPTESAGIFIKDDFLEFPSTKPGEKSELKFHLCNRNNVLQKVSCLYSKGKHGGKIRHWSGLFGKVGDLPRISNLDFLLGVSLMLLLFVGLSLFT